MNEIIAKAYKTLEAECEQLESFIASWAFGRVILDYKDDGEWKRKEAFADNVIDAAIIGHGA